MPEVCVRSWCRVIAALSAGTSEKYLAMGSATLSRPSSSSLRMAAAVNCLVMEPRHETVAGPRDAAPAVGQAVAADQRGFAGDGDEDDAGEAEFFQLAEEFGRVGGRFPAGFGHGARSLGGRGRSCRAGGQSYREGRGHDAAKSAFSEPLF
jgi:hypothetical protein